MKTRLCAGLLALGISAALLSIPAEARCEDSSHCRVIHGNWNQVSKHGSRKAVRHHASAALSAKRQQVVAMIKARAPSYGVPVWFALRIAKIESGYNPSARGRAGELGVFQMKCATARGIGYRGGCSGLLNASTGVSYGLKHLAMAVRSAHGNLKLAASKHNGGLGRKRLVPHYVAMVF